MAGKRMYITVSHRDWLLLRRIGVFTQECGGQVARRFVLQGLYHQLSIDSDLQDYDAECAAEERAEALRRGR